MFQQNTQSPILNVTPMFDNNGTRIYPCECVEYGRQDDDTLGLDSPCGPAHCPLGDDCIAYRAP